MTITLEISTIGDYEDQDLRDFIEFELSGGSIANDNPFIIDEGGAEITRVDLE